MTRTLHLPALDGRDPLGFLTALGVLRLLTDSARLNPRLSFDETTATATLHSELDTIDEVVNQLASAVASIPDDGVIPDTPAAFPKGKDGRGKDPARPPRGQYRAVTSALGDGDRRSPSHRWASVLTTDLAVDSDGRVGLTPYNAPVGQQSLRGMFTKPLDHVRTDPHRHLREALSGWRRVDGYTGESLDHRALRSAADHPTGLSTPAGVPGATWLAIMALPLLRLTGTGTTVQATCWHHLAGTKQAIMAWPLWCLPLDTHAIAALLEHPDLRPISNSTQAAAPRGAWPALGVFTMAAATRIPTPKSAGTLTPAPLNT
ncbi:hypothetical protein [Micromonospora sp. NPDC050276]|uniref:type I-G CRISPR-associated protein, Cas3-extension family n=1 Tax=Micromonospora sp. NPDC050276 TaxID=3364278 RepID=UPI00379835C8